jgi:hypothetical protein
MKTTPSKKNLLVSYKWSEVVNLLRGSIDGGSIASSLDTSVCGIGVVSLKKARPKYKRAELGKKDQSSAYLAVGLAANGLVGLQVDDLVASGATEAALVPN